jgi:hypothetical protein
MYSRERGLGLVPECLNDVVERSGRDGNTKGRSMLMVGNS